MAIGLINDYGDSIGNSGFYVKSVLNENGSKYLRYFTDKIQAFDGGRYIESWVQYKNARRTGNTNVIHHYLVGFYVAHEFLHQMIIKAFCSIYWSDN